MKFKARRTVFLSYPVELVWKAIGVGGDGRGMDPLTEEEFENKEPAPDTVFTRGLEVKQNEVFSFQMKGKLFFSTLRIELEAFRPCETKMTVYQEVEPRNGGGWFCLLGMNVKREVKTFCDQIKLKLENEYNQKAHFE